MRICNAPESNHLPGFILIRHTLVGSLQAPIPVMQILILLALGTLWDWFSLMTVQSAPYPQVIKREETYQKCICQQ
jgi:hypothetical protein